MPAATKRRPRPISLSAIVKQQHAELTAALTRSRPEGSSVELTRNAKGDVQIKVTVAAGEGEAIAATSARAQAVYNDLAGKYALSPQPTPIR